MPGSVKRIREDEFAQLEQIELRDLADPGVLSSLIRFPPPCELIYISTFRMDKILTLTTGVH